MGKIRHIAYRAADVESMANFFVNALGMTITQRRKNRAIDLSDGTINITLLPKLETGRKGEPPHQGIDHIGFTVEDDDEASRRLEAAGAQNRPHRHTPVVTARLHLGHHERPKHCGVGHARSSERREHRAAGDSQET